MKKFACTIRRMLVEVNCRFWTTSASGLTKIRKDPKYLIWVHTGFGPKWYCRVLWAFFHTFVVFCELFSTFLCNLWCFVDFFGEIKENIYVLSMFYLW